MRFIDYAVRLKLSSVLDFPYAIITFSGVSRVLTHQMVRHRLAAYMQQSMRFVKIPARMQRKYTPWYVIPPSVSAKDEETVAEFIVGNERAGRAYLNAIASGVPVEDARFLLPNGTKTHISMAADAEEWLHFLNVRTSTDAQWEIRRAALAALYCLAWAYPDLFGKPRIPKNIRAARVVPIDAPRWVYVELLKKNPTKIAEAIEEDGKYLLTCEKGRFELNSKNTRVEWLDTHLFSRGIARKIAKMARKDAENGVRRRDLTALIGTEVSEEKECGVAELVKKKLNEDIERISLSHKVVAIIGTR